MKNLYEKITLSIIAVTLFVVAGLMGFSNTDTPLGSIIRQMKIENASSTVINPATEEKQDDAITGLSAIETNQTDNSQTGSIIGVDYVAGKSGIDASTEALETIDYSHHEIHSGSHFYMSGFVELDDTDIFRMKVVTPTSTKWSHLIFDIKSTGICSSTLDEGASGGMAGGVSKIPLNNNRNSLATSTLVFTSGVTAPTSTVIRIDSDKWGANGFKESIGGGSSRDDEIILKQGTTYLRTFTSGADNNIIQFKVSWYEHTDKN